MSGAVIHVTRNNLPRMAARFGPAVADTINNGIENFLFAADPNTPVDTGALRANKTIAWASPGNYAGSVGYNQHYTIYVHDGTYKMDARPFASDALEAIRPGFMADMAAIPGRI